MSDHLGFPHQPGVAEDTEAQNVEHLGTGAEAGDTITDDDLNEDMADGGDDDDDPYMSDELDDELTDDSGELPF